MLNKYKQWINKRVPTSKEALGNCHVVCNEMKLIFPELTIIKGWCIDLSLPKSRQSQAHYWLEDENENLIDPTVSQFGNIHKYIPYIVLSNL